MRFYFNVNENVCADEDYVIDCLQEDMEWSREDIREKLHSCREYYGWYECEVSSTIKEKFNA